MLAPLGGTSAGAEESHRTAPMSEALSHSLGGILRHDGFRLLARCLAKVVKKVAETPEPPAGAHRVIPRRSGGPATRKGFAGFKPLFLPLTCLPGWRLDLPCPTYTRHTHRISRKSWLRAARRTGQRCHSTAGSGSACLEASRQSPEKLRRTSSRNSTCSSAVPSMNIAHARGSIVFARLIIFRAKFPCSFPRC